MKLHSIIMALILILSACKTGSPDTETSETAEQLTQAVCIANGTPVRETPSKDGKYLSSMSMGEKLIYLGETAVDSANKQFEYYRVELSDGTQAWARSYGILLNATPGAVLAQTPIYKRPDLVTKTEKSLNIIEFVAITSEKDDWYEVTGAEKKKSGWVKKQYISTNLEDVAVATLAYKELLDKEGKIVNEKLSSFIESLPNANSQLARYLQDQMAGQVEDAIEESIQDYEANEEVIEEQIN